LTVMASGERPYKNPSDLAG